ncbi:MAG TPA: alpha/beta hydrolase-fold protein [Bacteroidales bacterium]|nr:alpha/beta hydrolase-fold protein [Bacteroidales bacterium]
MMKKLHLFFCIILATLLCLNAVGQTDKDFKPADSNIPGSEFPKISPDNSVYFRLKAPNSTKVQIQGGDGLCPKALDMTKDTDGNWNIIIPKAGPGFHYYWFLVDGVKVNDPGSDTYFGYGRPTGGIEVPVSNEDFFYAKEVPHGDIREHWYFSEITGKWRRSFIYTPPDYDKNNGTRYPVLYLLHGAGENERGWSFQGRMGFIMDNLIAAKKAVPMIVVMDNGYATAKTESASGSTQSTTIDDIENVYIKDIIPEIDSFYRTITSRESRAIAGLSMGGRQTMSIGMKHLDLFSYFGFFSAPISRNILEDPKTAFNGVFSNGAMFNSRVKLMWFGAGSGETQFVKLSEDFRKKLDALGISSKGYISEGTYHEWHTWRRDLNEFAPLLFR